LLLSIVVPFLKYRYYLCRTDSDDDDDDDDGVRGLTTMMSMQSLTDLQQDTINRAHSTAKQKAGTHFSISNNINDAVYRQTLVMCGVIYCPVLPIVHVVFMFIFFYVKELEVMKFAKRPKNPMGVARQKRFFRLAVGLGLGVVLLPITSFLNSTPECGPHPLPITVAADFSDEFDRLPESVLLAYDYISNSVLLWMAVITLIIWILGIKRRQARITKEIKSTRHRLKMEAYEREKIIKAYNVQLGYGEVRGVEMFEEWVAELGEIGEKYGPKIVADGYGNLTRLCKLRNDQVEGMLFRHGATPEAVATILEGLEDARLTLI